MGTKINIIINIYLALTYSLCTPFSSFGPSKENTKKEEKKMLFSYTSLTVLCSLPN